MPAGRMSESSLNSVLSSDLSRSTFLIVGLTGCFCWKFILLAVSDLHLKSQRPYLNRHHFQPSPERFCLQRLCLMTMADGWPGRGEVGA